MKKLKLIMLVDDDSTTNFLHEDLISEMDITQEIIVAINGKEALEKLNELCLKKQCPDLILLDINMPVMSGFEFLEKFNEMNPGGGYPAKIVILTSSSYPGDAKKAQELRVTEYISKPLEENSLEMILSKHF